MESSYKKLGFLPNFNFDQRSISQLTQDCFSKVLTEELLDQLRKNFYFIIVDNATFGGENLSAIKVKYLDRQWSSELNHDITLVHNKIISLTNLKDTSSGQTLNEIIHEKLFRDQDITKSLVGFVLDNASNLKGDNFGLSSLLKKVGCIFLDICDPCHGLALSIKHSLKELPESIILFLQTISNHFSSPQNKAILRNIQKEGDFKVLTPKHLAPTRWLSLGQVLDRILEIWASNILNL